MRIKEGLDLTYCTNIHPGNGWGEVFGNLAAYAPSLKSRLAPDAPFGIGLRLSNRESEEVLSGNGLDALADFLAANGMYVRLLNGYPFGTFHRAPLKAGVFAPDWRDEARTGYTLRLLEILGRLLPENGSGGISTSPLSYKAWIHSGDSAAMRAMVRNLARVACEMVRVERELGRKIRLEIEPEPGGLIENSLEVVSFFRDWLLPVGSPWLATALGLSRGDAEQAILDHICLCFDACHFAVEYEDPETALRVFAAAGIRIGRVQVSSALRVMLPGVDIAARLAPFADSTYLHQVIEKREDGSLRHYHDIDEALRAKDDPGRREWRIHFHVPLFVAEYGPLGSTQEFNTRLLRYLQLNPFTEHLEIETYTWDLLPGTLKLNLKDSIEREYRWVMGKTCEKQ
jgi:sugar phosphate isomerase/epimerase